MWPSSLLWCKRLRDAPEGKKARLTASPLCVFFLAPSLCALSQKGITAEIEQFAKERPEQYKAVMATIAEADKPEIRATVAEAKPPSSIKYTIEGTMLHDMMSSVAVSDRRMRAIAELEWTLTAEDKAAMKKAQVDKAAEMGLDPATMKDFEIPDKIKVGA